MTKDRIIEALKEGSKKDDIDYDSGDTKHCKLDFHDDGTVRLDYFAHSWDDVGGNDSYEQSIAAIPTDPLDQVIAHAIQTESGKLEVPVTLFQHLYGRDTYEEFDEHREKDITLKISIQPCEEDIKIDISW